MDVWTSKSSPGKQLAASALCAVVGLVLMIALRGLPAQGSNAAAGFGLGILLLIIGVAGVFVSGPQTVVVDAARRRIVVEDSYLVGSRKREIAFGDIVSVGIGYLGKKTSGVTTYYLVLHLGDGHEYSLFAPGRFYDGASDRSVVEGWMRRLEGCLGRDRRPSAADEAGMPPAF